MIIAHKDKVNFATDYPAFEWVYNTANSGDINGRWYIPAKEELKALYGKYTDETDTNVDEDVKTAVNLSLNAISKTRLSGYIWSSTECSPSHVWSIDFIAFNNGRVDQSGKTFSNHSVRVVSAF